MEQSNTMTKLTEQEIAEGWKLNTGRQPVPDDVMLDGQIGEHDFETFLADDRFWEKRRDYPITKWRINPDYKAKLEEQARAVFPELNWPEKIDPLEAKVEAIIKECRFGSSQYVRTLVMAGIKAGMEMKS